MSSVIAGFVVGAVMGTVCFWVGYFCNRFVERIDDLYVGFFSHRSVENRKIVNEFLRHRSDIDAVSRPEPIKDIENVVNDDDDSLTGEHDIATTIMEQVKKRLLYV